MITENRKELAELLAAGDFPVVDHEPDRPAPGEVIIAAASPWITPGNTFATNVIHWRILATARPGVRSQVITDLEAKVETILGLLENIEVTWEVSEPLTLIVGNDTIPAVEITLQITT